MYTSSKPIINFELRSNGMSYIYTNLKNNKTPNAIKNIYIVIPVHKPLSQYWNPVGQLQQASPAVNGSICAVLPLKIACKFLTLFQ